MIQVKCFQPVFFFFFFSRNGSAFCVHYKFNGTKSIHEMQKGFVLFIACHKNDLMTVNTTEEMFHFSYFCDNALKKSHR